MGHAVSSIYNVSVELGPRGFNFDGESPSQRVVGIQMLTLRKEERLPLAHIPSFI